MATIRQKKTFTKMVENGGKVAPAMIAGGYSKKTARTPKKMTETKGWKELMEQYLPEKELAKAHKELLEQKQLAYFVFPKKMTDKEIEANMIANGLDLIVIQESMKGRMAFYSIIDANARKSALDMGYKLKGSYAPDKLDVKGELKVEKLEEIQQATRKILEN
jgi:hypothetical protein